MQNNTVKRIATIPNTCMLNKVEQVMLLLYINNVYNKAHIVTFRHNINKASEMYFSDTIQHVCYVTKQ